MPTTVSPKKPPFARKSLCPHSGLFCPQPLETGFPFPLNQPEDYRRGKAFFEDVLNV